MYRTIENGKLRKEHAGQSVELVGWVAKKRNLGSYIFIDLRDRSGIVQVMVKTDEISIPEIRNEYVIHVKGVVKIKDQPNPNLLTGEVEVSNDQKDKENRERIKKEQNENFNETIIKAVKAIDPTCEPYQKYSSIYMTFKKGDAIIDVEPGDNSRLEITTISFPDVDFGDFREIHQLQSILMPDKSSSYNSCELKDSKHNTIYYPKLSLRRTWDVNRVVKEINNYLDNIINIVTGYTNVEEFI